ncbi:MAG TPA: AI-2E family transporter [Actinomycetes bacterium]|nr:AI-2E family transporter [Actinomycetes bacterium]
MLRKRSRTGTPSPAPAAVAPGTQPTSPREPIDGIETPHVLRFTAAWSWRLLLVVAAVWVLLQLFALLSVVLVPVIIGLLLAAVASPIADRITSWGLPRGLATVVTIALGLSLIVGLVTLVAQQFSSGFGDLRDQFDQSLGQLERYLADLGLSRAQLQDFFDRVRDGVGSGESNLGGTVVRTATTAGHLLAGLFIVLFATIFFTYDGRNIWRWVVRLFPDQARARVEGSGVRAWAVLTAYVRATVIIAAVDALGIAIVALVLGLPLVLPLAVLVFMGAFIPVVGATISGIAAVAVALVSEGPVQALIMLAGVIGVQQLEGHVLQPFLMGRLVRVHPLAIVVVIAIGGLVAGLFGALIAVPLTAIVNAVATYLAGERRQRLEHESGAAADPALTT